MKNNYFEYNTPRYWELREEFVVPYRFSIELREYVRYMFQHPQHSKYRNLFTNLHTDQDLNDMLKVPYLIIRHYQKYPQQYGHQLNNIVPHIIVSMWKAFINLHKQLRGVQFNQYYPASMKLITLGENQFLDIFISDIQNQNIIYSGDDMVKVREGVGLRERKPMGYSEKDLKYYESLDG